MKLITMFLSSLALVAMLGCGGTAEIGEECDTAGNKDECVDGAICTNVAAALTCRKVCTDQMQCAANEDCNGVSGSNEKSCQPK